MFLTQVNKTVKLLKKKYDCPIHEYTPETERFLQLQK